MKYSIFLFSFLYALTNSQINILKIAYKTGKQYQANDGHVFDDTICAIILTESSAGKFLIGDNYYSTGKEKPFLEKSLGVGQIQLQTAIRIIKKYPVYFPNYVEYLHKNPYAYKIYSKYLVKINYFENIIKRYRYKKSKRAKRVLKWAKRELKYYKRKMKKYKKYYINDYYLAQYLLSDVKFNIKIAVLHLIDNYNEALKRKMHNPFFKAISRYNGGWSNRKYYKKVVKNMKVWRKIKNDYFNKK